MELTRHLHHSESGTIEYLRRALPDKLARMLKGVTSSREAWARLDERFADRVGSIRTVIRQLQEADLSASKSYEKMERLDQEIRHATYLLQGLEAENKLSEDLNLVGHLLKKLPSEMRREWVRHRSSITPDPTPGETEWPHFVEWVRGQKKSALIERWYDEADPIQAPTTKVLCKK